MNQSFIKRNYRWIILAACILTYCTSTLVRWNYTSISKYLSGDLGIGKPELGLLGSAFFYAYSLAQVPMGIAADKFGGRRVIPLGTGLVGLFLVGFAFSSTFTETLIWRALMGFVSAAGYVPITSILSKWFAKKERGLAVETNHGLGGGLGEAFAFFLIPYLALIISSTELFGKMASWRGSTILMGIMIVAIAIVIHFMFRSDPSELGLPSIEAAEDKKQDADYKARAHEILRDPALWLLALVWSGYIIANRLIVGWFPVFAADYYMHFEGMTKEAAMVAGGAMSTIWVVGRTVGSPIIGKLSDHLLKKFGMPRSVALLTGLVLTTGILFLFSTVVPSAKWLVALAFFSGVILNINGLVNASAAEIWSIRTAGFSMGIINMVGQFIGAASLSLSGFMAVKFAIKGGPFYTEYNGIWYLGILCCVLASLAAVYIVYREKKEVAERQHLTTDNHS